MWTYDKKHDRKQEINYTDMYHFDYSRINLQTKYGEK